VAIDFLEEVEPRINSQSSTLLRKRLTPGLEGGRGKELVRFLRGKLPGDLGEEATF